MFHLYNYVHFSSRKRNLCTQLIAFAGIFPTVKHQIDSLYHRYSFKWEQRMSREACNKKKHTLRSLPVHAIPPMLFELHVHHYLSTNQLYE